MYFCNILPIYNEKNIQNVLFYHKKKRILIEVIVHVHAQKILVRLQFGVY